jgi:hypothetical protein
MKIYDCFSFYNELDLLELRLKELYDHVDHFVLVESSTTHQNNPKPYYFEENKQRYQQYLDKIIHIKVDDMPMSADTWVNERFQRDQVLRGLVDADEDDMVLLSDLDEFIRPEIVDEIRENPKNISGFRVPFFNFKLNYMLINHPESYHVWAVACKRKFLEDPSAFRSMRFALTQMAYNFEDDDIRIYEHSGWHFTYFGNTDWVKNKLRNFAHAELNKDHVLDQIDVDAMIARGSGFNPLDQRTFVKIAVDDYLPKNIVNNQDQYKASLLTGEAKNAREYLPFE